MRTVATAVAIAAAVLAPVAASAGVTSACQEAIAKSGAKFTKATLKIGQRCAIRGGAASCQPSADGPTGNKAVDAGIARASTRLGSRVVGACSGSDLSAFTRPCTGVAGPALAVQDLVSCLRNTHLEEVAQLLAIEFPALAPVAAEAAGCAATNQSCQCKCSPSGAFLEPPAGHGS